MPLFPQNAVLTTFTGADENPLSEGGNWVANVDTDHGDLQLTSNAAAGTAVAACDMYWTTSFAANCEAFFTVSTIPSAGKSVGAFLRLTGEGTATPDGYLVLFGPLAMATYRMDDGALTQLAASVIALANGDVVGARISGNVIQGYLNGEPVGTGAVDSTYTTGTKIGLFINDTTARVDSFGGGTYTAGGVGGRPRHRLRGRSRSPRAIGGGTASVAGVTASYEWWPGVAPNNYADSAALIADNGGANDFASDDKNYLVPTASGDLENAAARTEWGTNGQVALDTTVGLTPSTKSMKYTWPADCGKDCELRRNIQLPIAQAELWAEFVVRFSNGWTADGPESGNIDYKFIFGRLDSDRFILKVFTGGNNVFNFGQPPGGEDNYSSAMASSIADGANHVIRLHFKRSTTASSGDGGIRLMVDDVDKGGSLALNTTVGGVLCSTIYGLALGANINQGVGATPQTLHWLRVRVWYEGNDPGWGI